MWLLESITEWGDGVFYSIELLANLRKDRGITQKQLADVVGTTQARIAEYETGKRNPKVKMLFAIAKALNMKLYADNETEELFFMED